MHDTEMRESSRAHHHQQRNISSIYRWNETTTTTTVVSECVSEWKIVKLKAKCRRRLFTIATRSFSHSLRIRLVNGQRRRACVCVCANAWVCKAKVVVHIMLFSICHHMLCPPYGWVSACGWVCVGANDWMKFLLLFALISHSLANWMWVCVCVRAIVWPTDL